MLSHDSLRPGLVFEREGPALTQAAFSDFGRLLGTDAPIHNDPAYAKASGFGGTIAQGMLLAAPYESWLCELFGEAAWTAGGRIAVRLRSPAWAGDRVRMTLTVCGVANGVCTLAIESRCEDRCLLTGSATLALLS
jgi:acyl dehydratase